MLAMIMVAALPPFAEDTRTLDAIMHCEEIHQYIPFGDCLQEIAKTEGGYILTTNKRQVLVLIHYLPSNCLGPRDFTLEFISSIDGVIRLDESDSSDNV